MAKNNASPAQVRAFAAEQGVPVGARGRFSATLIDAFNKANGRNKYVPGGHVVLVTTRGTRVLDTGRKVPASKTASYDEIRAAAAAAGVTAGLGSRGRVSAQVLSAFATGTLSSLAPSVQS